MSNLYILDRPSKNEPAHWHYDINFLFVTDEQKIVISNESLEIKWVNIEEARVLISPEDYAMQRMLIKYENWLNKAK